MKSFSSQRLQIKEASMEWADPGEQQRDSQMVDTTRTPRQHGEAGAQWLAYHPRPQFSRIIYSLQSPKGPGTS